MKSITRILACMVACLATSNAIATEFNFGFSEPTLCYMDANGNIICPDGAVLSSEWTTVSEPVTYVQDCPNCPPQQTTRQRQRTVVRSWGTPVRSSNSCTGGRVTYYSSKGAPQYYRQTTVKRDGRRRPIRNGLRAVVRGTAALVTPRRSGRGGVFRQRTFSRVCASCNGGGYGASWTWPGGTANSLRHHLTQTPHGLTPSQLAGMSYACMKRQHDHDHNEFGAVSGGQLARWNDGGQGTRLISAPVSTSRIIYDDAPMIVRQ